MIKTSHGWQRAIQATYRSPATLDLSILKQKFDLCTVGTRVPGGANCFGGETLYNWTKCYASPLNSYPEADRYASLEDGWWMLDGTFHSQVDNSDSSEQYYSSLKEAVAPVGQGITFPKKPYQDSNFTDGRYHYMINCMDKGPAKTDKSFIEDTAYIDNTVDLLLGPIEDLYIVFDNVRYTGPKNLQVSITYNRGDHPSIVRSCVFNVDDGSYQVLFTKADQINRLYETQATSYSKEYFEGYGIEKIDISWTSWSDPSILPRLSVVSLGGEIAPEEGWNIIDAEYLSETSCINNALPTCSLEISLDNTDHSFDPTKTRGIAAQLYEGMYVCTRWGLHMSVSGAVSYLPWDLWVLDSLSVPTDYSTVKLTLVPELQKCSSDIYTGQIVYDNAKPELKQTPAFPVKSIAQIVKEHLQEFIADRGGVTVRDLPTVPRARADYQFMDDSTDRSQGILQTLNTFCTAAGWAMRFDTHSSLLSFRPLGCILHSVPISETALIQLSNLEQQESIDSMVFQEVSVDLKTEEVNTEDYSIELTEKLIRRLQSAAYSTYTSSTAAELTVSFRPSEWQNLRVDSNPTKELFWPNTSLYRSGWCFILFNLNDIRDYSFSILPYTAYLYESDNVGQVIHLSSSAWNIANPIKWRSGDYKYKEKSATGTAVNQTTEFVENSAVSLVSDGFISVTKCDRVPPTQYINYLKTYQSLMRSQANSTGNAIVKATRYPYVATLTYLGQPDIQPLDSVELVIPEIDETKVQTLLVLSNKVSFDGGFSGELKGLVLTDG